MSLVRTNVCLSGAILLWWLQGRFFNVNDRQADLAVAQVRRGIGVEAHARDGAESHAADQLMGGSSCGAGGPECEGRSTGIISALRIPPWLPSGRGCQGRRLSRA